MTTNSNGDIELFADAQLRDYDVKTPGQLFEREFHDVESMSLEQAYSLQRAVVDLREQRGESVTGYKVGCTSPTMQQQLNIRHPVFGRLFVGEAYPSESDLPFKNFARPAIEGELAVHMAKDLSADTLADDVVKDAIESATLVIELHNYVFRRDTPTAVELVANNAINAGFVYASAVPFDFCNDEISLSITIDDQLIDSVSSCEFGSTIIGSLQWLAKTLVDEGLQIKAGQTILCGSIAALHPVEPNSHVKVVTDRLGSVSCNFTTS